MYAPKYIISSSIQKFRALFIPNPIPVSIMLLDPNPLLPNPLHILHVSLHSFSLSHSLMPYIDFSKTSDPVLHDLLLQAINDCPLPARYTNW
jgi:hypothetical protein